VLAALWEAAARLSLYNTALLPPPTGSVIALAKLWNDGTLASDLIDSMYRYIPGFIIGSVVGVFMGVLTGTLKNVGYAVNPVFHYLRSIPPVALIPFILVLFGIDDIGKVSLVAWACMFPVWLNTQAGIAQVPKEYIQAAKVFGVNGWRRVFDILLPSSLPQIVSGLRIAVATGFFALAAAEIFAGSSGIGFRIVYSHQLFQTDAMVGVILFLGLLAFLADFFLFNIRKALVRWEDV